MKTPHHNSHLLLERIAFFSDAVFAIAMTLLVIEIKVPEMKNNLVSDEILWEQLGESIPKIIGVLVSFSVIGLYWASHHRLFGYIDVYSKKLVWPNLFFLLTIIFMPFTTAYLSEYYNPLIRMPVILYGINICLTGIASFRLWSIGTDSRYKISSISNDIVLKKYQKTRALLIPGLFIFIIILSFFSGWIPYVIFPFLPFVTFFIKKRFKKKYPEYAAEF